MPIELDVLRMVYGGNAICRTADGCKVFTPYCLPGERVLAEILASKKGYSIGKLTDILEASAERIEPRCKHFMQCGGCSYQHTSYHLQLSIKEMILSEQLSRLGKISSPPINPIITSDQEWHYRNVMQFHVTPQGVLGMQAPNSHQIIPISECHLPTNGITNLLSSFDLSEDHNIERMDIREGSDQSILITLNSTHPDIPQISCDIPVSIIHNYRGHPVSISGEDYVTYTLLEQEFKVSSGSFFQINTDAAAKMIRLVCDYVRKGSFSTIFDLYAGVGLFSKFLSPMCNKIIAVESSSSACDDYVENLDQSGNCELYIGDVEEILPHINEKVDLILLDPPRVGLKRGVFLSVENLSPKAIIYISCDPSTLARDLGFFLQIGYKLKEVTPIDMFPQTFHIESICHLERV